tara:strand:+ start:2690 stop:3172 length:483 start_codon:yes stop_codon:yes gene_type:complete
MSKSVTWPNNEASSTGSIDYKIPETGDTSWGNLTLFLEALGNNAQSTSGQKVSSVTRTALPHSLTDADCIFIYTGGTPGAGPPDEYLYLPPIVNHQIVYVKNYCSAASNITVSVNFADIATDLIVAVAGAGTTTVDLAQNEGALFVADSSPTPDVWYRIL